MRECRRALELGALQLGGAAAAALGPEAEGNAAYAQRDAGGAGTDDRQETGVYHVRCFIGRGAVPARSGPDRPGNG